nr:cytochrome P450 [Candidatus Protofrankia californiensis]
MTDSILPHHAEEVFVFNPFADGFTDNPCPHYAELRTTAPAHEHPLGFWILSRYEDVSKLQRSGHSVDEQYLTHLPLWKSDSSTLGKENRLMRGLSILDQDPPNHTRLRRLVPKAFTRFVQRFPSPAVEDVHWNGRINVRGPAKLSIAVR